MKRHRRWRLDSRWVRTGLASFALCLLLLGMFVSRGRTASAEHVPEAAPALNFYLAAPNVENTDVGGTDVMTFNTATVGTCPATWQTDGGTTIGTITGSGCNVVAAGTYGGAITTADGNPVSRPGGTGTNYASVPGGQNVTLTLAAPRNYIGFWWSAGDPNNTLTLYSGGVGGTVVGRFTTATIVQFLNSGVGSITSIGGTSYQTCNYWGNPRLAASPCPSTASTPSEPFAYIHLFGVNGLQFDTIKFSQASGGGFEFDNLAVATTESGPGNALIGLPPSLTATDSSQSATTCTPFTSNLGWAPSNFLASPTFSVTPALPAGLTLDSATGEVSGTPTAVAGSTTYTMTATNDSQSATATFTLGVTNGGNLPCGGTTTTTGPAIAPPGRPGPPAVTPKPGGLEVTVVPPATGGTPESYRVIAGPGGQSCTVTGAAGSCTIEGLLADEAYTITVVASNAGGDSPPSEATGPFTPLPASGSSLPSTGSAATVLADIGLGLVALGSIVAAQTLRRRRLEVSALR